MNGLQKHILRITLLLLVFAVVATALVAFINQQTRDQIEENEKQALLSTFNALIPTDRYDNDILSDTLLLPPTEALGNTEETPVYRARLKGDPSAVILTVTAPNGYSGGIKMLIGIYADGTIAGVRVINHKETPGLGDKIEEKRDNWIYQFEGLSLENPSPAKWKVKKDGGDFDQFTGATITPRAVVGAIKRSLEYFSQHADTLFSEQEEQS